MVGSFPDKKGFTLIEIIVVLLILGSLGVLGAMALVHMIDSHQWARDNAHLTQKAQVALTRISVELNYAENVNIRGGGSRINYDAAYPDGQNIDNNNIGVQGNQNTLRLALNGPLQQGRVLTDRVTRFEVSRPNSQMIEIVLGMQGENQVEKTFTTAVAHR